MFFVGSDLDGILTLEEQTRYAGWYELTSIEDSDGVRFGPWSSSCGCGSIMRRMWSREVLLRTWREIFYRSWAESCLSKKRSPFYGGGVTYQGDVAPSMLLARRNEWLLYEIRNQLFHGPRWDYCLRGLTPTGSTFQQGSEEINFLHGIGVWTFQ